MEIYVRPFPNVEEGRWQISRGSNDDIPLWSPDGRELFYFSGNKMMAVAIQSEPNFTYGISQVLFERSSLALGYDIHPDGQRFLMIKPATEEVSAPTELILVLNWFEELKRLVPTDK